MWISKTAYMRTPNRPDFEVLLVSFRAPGRELQQFSPREDGFDREVARLFFEALSDESLILKAHNAQFERVCTGAYFKRVIHPDRWRCTAVLCAAAGLPRSLDESGRALGLAEDEKAQDRHRPYKLFLQALQAYRCQRREDAQSSG